jgi:hypothetical protein
LPGNGDLRDEIDDWMEHRKAAVGQFIRDAEAAGRRAWNDATRTGQEALGRTQSELARLGAQQLRQSRAGPGVAGRSAKPAPNGWLDRSSAAKAAAGDVAHIAGNIAGIGRGVFHSAESLGQGARFATRLLDPTEPAIKGPSNSTWGQMFNSAQGLVDYADKAIRQPRSVASDLQNLGHRLYVDTLSRATPVADTFGGEMERNFKLGANQGELGWDVGSLAFGGAASKALRELSPPAKYVGQGFTPAQADYLAAPYEGMGHHHVPRWAAKALGLPPSLSDSIFNVLNPRGMSRGDFYALHYQVDPHFRSANLPKALGGPGAWQGKNIGLQKYGPWASLWHGSPAPLNAAIGTAGVNNLAGFDPSERGD